VVPYPLKRRNGPRSFTQSVPTAKKLDVVSMFSTRPRAVFPARSHGRAGLPSRAGFFRIGFTPGSSRRRGTKAKDAKARAGSVMGRVGPPARPRCFLKMVRGQVPLDGADRDQSIPQIGGTQRRRGHRANRGRIIDREQPTPSRSAVSDAEFEQTWARALRSQCIVRIPKRTFFEGQAPAANASV
jgi:hypothetical protein